MIRHLGNDPALVDQLWDSAWFWRRAAAVLATVALALLVAALIAREPPDFAQRPVIAVLQNTGRHPAWAIRLARSAHQIAIDSLDPPRPPLRQSLSALARRPRCRTAAARPAAGVGAQNYRRDPGEHPAAGRLRVNCGSRSNRRPAPSPERRADRRCLTRASTASGERRAAQPTRKDRSRFCQLAAENAAAP